MLDLAATLNKDTRVLQDKMVQMFKVTVCGLGMVYAAA